MTLQEWCKQNNKENLLKEWNYERNAELIDGNGKDISNPNNVTSHSHQKVWWKCSKGHEWQAVIKSRTNGCNCPVCSKHLIIKGINDLATTNFDLIDEWNYDKNIINPTEISAGSNEKVWWKCKKGHEWQAIVASRTKMGNGCPYCNGHFRIKGVNDLATTNPKLLSEWDYKKNIIDPTKVSAKSQKKVWWKCLYGHEWQAYINNRVRGNRCPICAKASHTSFPEQALFFYIKKYFSDAINSDNDAIGMELDIYIPSSKIAVEYDGVKWHKDKDNEIELKKNKLCKDNNILLIRIREEGLDLYNDCYCIVRTNIKSNNSLAEVIKKVLLKIDNTLKIDINIDRDSISIYDSYIIMNNSKSLANNYPEVAKEWHPTKNGKITPKMVSYGTSKKMWWQCEKGHEWQAKVSNRVHGRNCPICSNKKIVSKKNDLLTQYPDICKYWDYEKNDEIKLFPDKISSGSAKKAWWKCEHGHSWQTSIADIAKGLRCPYCSGHRVWKGFNDLATTNPELIDEWNYEKNGEKTPFTISKGHSKVWWKCKHGHEWQAAVYARTKGAGCPVCANQKIIKGINDLFTKYPNLSKEWDYDKNNKINLFPDKLSAGSHKKVWWKCKNGHSWQTKIYLRTKGNGCPICSNRKIINGINDLSTQYPELLSEWDYSKNSISPTEVSGNSTKKVWWKCKHGHSWQSEIYRRVKDCQKCPECCKKTKLKSVICIETKIVYESLKDAMNKTGIERHTIGNCCRGISKTAGGYHWKYLDDNK